MMKNKQTITRVGENVKKLEPLCIAGGNGTAIVENTVAIP